MQVLTVLIALASALAVSSSAEAATIPQRVSVQGILKNASGQPVDATVSIQFLFYDAPTGGTVLWQDTLSVNVSKGRYGVILGSTANPITVTVFQTLTWLAMNVNADGEMTPRVKVATAPYAFAAEQANSANTASVALTLGGLLPSDYSAAVHNHSGADITSGIVSDPYIDALIARDSEIFPAVLANAGAGSLLDADLLDGLDSMAFWQIGGNTGLIDGTSNIFGTTDAVPLRIITNAATRIYVDSTGEVGIGTLTPNSPLTVAGIIETTSGGIKFPDALVQGWASPSRYGAGNESVIGGGASNNTASLDEATVGGGWSNLASGGYSTIGGGQANAASGQWATLLGGHSNTASGDYAAVPGGRSNAAAGDYSFAAGRRAKVDALHDGAFLFADQTDLDFNSAAANEFAARATGGVRFVTADDGAGVPMAGVFVGSGGTSWGAISDRNKKKDFRPVAGESVLVRLGSMPITSWRYVWEPGDSVPHIGPVAQDFKALFYPGRDDKTISTLEFDGVELAAIQALIKRTEKLGSQNQRLKQENAALRERLERVEEVLGVQAP